MKNNVIRSRKMTRNSLYKIARNPRNRFIRAPPKNPPLPLRGRRFRRFPSLEGQGWVSWF
jgi:hypothetical protein